MKRSQVNSIIHDAINLFESQRFLLPPWAYYSVADWRNVGERAKEIFDLQLGWDITDFGSGDFYKKGLVLFTLRNGKLNSSYQKPYAEKIMISYPGQVTPMHFHWNKWEDIINRGGGELAFRLYMSDDNEKPVEDIINVSVDGITRTVKAGEELLLYPGESLLLSPYLYHEFFAVKEPVMIGEVSMVNDDNTDNCFRETVGRFPEIEEDTSPEFLLCTEYRKFFE